MQPSDEEVSTPSIMRKSYNYLGIYSISILLFSLFFWSWALKNTISMAAAEFDLGVISFGTSCLSTSYLLALANLKVQPKLLTRVLILSSYGLVSLNYILGVYVGIVYMKRPGFAIYCGTFALLWIGILTLGLKLMTTSPRGPFLTNETSNLV